MEHRKPGAVVELCCAARNSGLEGLSGMERKEGFERASVMEMQSGLAG